MILIRYLLRNARLLAGVALLASMFFGGWMIRSQHSQLTQALATIEKLETEIERARTERDRIDEVRAVREAEIERLSRESGELRRLIDDARNTNKDAPLPGLARDYLERLRND